MNSYCRIEVASANPVPTEAYPTARTARGDLRSSCTPDRLRKVAIGHHHRGIGPIVAGAMLTPHQKPQCKTADPRRRQPDAKCRSARRPGPRRHLT
jgi:hypothetical protein